MKTTINGVDLELDVFEQADAAKLEVAIGKVEAAVKAIQTDKSAKTLAVLIGQQCQIVFDFFNEMFGEGTDAMIFGESVNMKTATLAYRQFIEAVKSEKNSMGEWLKLD